MNKIKLKKARDNGPQTTAKLDTNGNFKMRCCIYASRSGGIYAGHGVLTGMKAFITRLAGRVASEAARLG